MENVDFLHRGIFCASCSEVNFWISSMYFRFFVIFSPSKSVWPPHLTILNVLFPRMRCAKFGWNLHSGSEEVLNFIYVFSLCLNYLPIEKGVALHLNKLESPSHKDALCQVCSKFANSEEDFIFLWIFAQNACKSHHIM